ncbi:MAG: hypothetical protein WBX01_04590 [Nitrososphaeraceae archaeon]
MESRKFAIVTAIAALLFVISAVSTIIPERLSAYQRNQAASQTSDCGNEFTPTNTGCQNADSQIQGDENSVALAAQQTFPEVKLVQERPSHPPPEPQTAILNVVKKVICPTEFTNCPEPEDVIIDVLGNNQDPISFMGSYMGTPVSLNPGPYHVEEGIPIIDGLIILPPVLSPECKGNIQAGEELTCKITNEYELETAEEICGDGIDNDGDGMVDEDCPTTLNVVKEVVCTDSAVANIPQMCNPSWYKMIILSGNNPVPDSFPGSSTGTPVSLGPGNYFVTETIALMLGAHVTSSDSGCSGDIQDGQELTCTLTNFVDYEEPPQ